MKLNVPERLATMTILPQEGNFITLRLIRDLMAKLGLSAEEMAEFGIQQIDGMVTWNEKGAEERDFPLKEKEYDLIKESLVKMDKAKKLEQRHFSLYEKFAQGGNINE